MGRILQFSHDGWPPPPSQGSSVNEQTQQGAVSSQGLPTGTGECGPGETEEEGDGKRGGKRGGLRRGRMQFDVIY